MTELAGKMVAVIAADGFEQDTFTALKQRLEIGGGEVHLLSPGGAAVQGCCFGKEADRFEADGALESAAAEDYDALVLPGGLPSVETLAGSEVLGGFLTAGWKADRFVGASGTAVSILIRSLPVEGRKMTSDPALQRELAAAGVDWMNRPVMKDDKVVTSRSAGEAEAFVETLCACLIETQPFLASA